MLRATRVPTAHLRARAIVVANALTFVLAGCAPATMRTSPDRSTPMPSSGRELTRDEQVRHVLNRLTFGPRSGDIATVSSIGVDAWIDAQLHPTTIPDTLAERVLSGVETQRKHAFELLADHIDPQEVQQRINQSRTASGGAGPFTFDSAALRASQQTAQRLAVQIPSARMLRAVASERQLQELMVDFWENHFSVFLGKSPNRYSMVEYDRDVIRPRALGKFRELLGAVAKSPQMLFYLDNWQSGVDSLHPNIDEERIERRRVASSDSLVRAFARLPRRRPRGLNENYARELMELHTLGVDGGYSQKDVQEVARALTGWTIEAPQFGGGFVFRPELHDAGEKTVLGHALPAGRGIADGEDVLDILAHAPATAHFIAAKLARHFVSDDPPASLVDRCAGAFTKTDGDIRETMRCIITSPEFFSRAAYRAKVKTPFELVASAMRALNAPPDTTPRTAQLVAQLGQPIYGRSTPDGWPDRGEAWMNSGSILNRINLGQRLAAGQFPGVRLTSWPPAARLRQLSTDQQIRGALDELLGGDVSQETRQILSGGVNPLLSPASTGTNPTLPAGLSGIVGMILGSPEFQRR
jgi:uncharacterized protein (DUF1800 family)